MTVGQVTALLRRWRLGEPTAEAELVDAVYPALHDIAARYMGKEHPAHTLQPTAVVHEAYLRLIRDRDRSWQNEAHFYAASAQVMRHILIDHARQRRAKKRGGSRHRVSLNEAMTCIEENPDLLLALDGALDRLESLDARQARVVTLKVFAGMTNKEIAQVVGASERTVKRDWLFARAWLYGQLSESGA